MSFFVKQILGQLDNGMFLLCYKFQLHGKFACGVAKEKFEGKNLKVKKRDWDLQYGCVTQSGRLVCGNRFK